MRTSHKVLRSDDGGRNAIFRRRVILPLAAILSCSLVVAGVLLVLISPTLSPLASYHDSDGDGHADLYDAAPRNPDLWASVSATIIVSLHSGHSFSDYNYTISVDGSELAQGCIAHGDTVVQNVTAHFLIGRSVMHEATVVVSATDGSIQQKVVSLESGGSYQMQFEIPT